MKELIEYIPNITAQLLLGGVFVFVFLTTSMRLSVRRSIPSFILLSYLIGSVIFEMAMNFCDTSWGKWSIFLYWFVVVCVDSIVAYLLAKFIKSNMFKSVCLSLGIHDSMERNYWTDLFDPDNGVYIRVFFDNDDYIEGNIHSMESDERYPQILIANPVYYKVNAHGESEVDYDYSESDCDMISVDVSKCKYVFLNYSEDSPVIIRRKTKK